jgi:hypothetical protein
MTLATSSCREDVLARRPCWRVLPFKPGVLAIDRLELPARQLTALDYQRGAATPPVRTELRALAPRAPELRYPRSSPSLRPRNEGHGRPHRGSHHQRPPTGTRAIGETTRPCRRDPPGASPPPDPHPETGRRSSSADHAQPHAIACSRRTSLASLSSITRSGTITHVSPSTSVDRFTESSPRDPARPARRATIRNPLTGTRNDHRPAAQEPERGPSRI